MRRPGTTLALKIVGKTSCSVHCKRVPKTLTSPIQGCVTQTGLKLKAQVEEPYTPLYTGFQDFRAYLRDFKDFRTDLRDFRDFKDFKDIKCTKGFRSGFKAFRPGSMDFMSDFRDFRSDISRFSGILSRI